MYNRKKKEEMKQEESKQFYERKYIGANELTQ